MTPPTDRRSRFGLVLLVVAGIVLAVGLAALVAGLTQQAVAADRSDAEVAQAEDAAEQLTQAQGDLAIAEQEARDAAEQLTQAQADALAIVEAAQALADAAAAARDANASMADLQAQADEAFLSGDIDGSNALVDEFDRFVGVSNDALDQAWSSADRIRPLDARVDEPDEEPAESIEA